MKRVVILLFALVVKSSIASDHSNIDSGRPLTFDDAYSIGFGERTFESGISLSRNKVQIEFEHKFGFAKNRELGVSLSAFRDSDNETLEFDEFKIFFFNGLQREINGKPAVAYKFEFGKHDSGREVEAKVRGIVSKNVGQYDRIHFNADINYNSLLRDHSSEINVGAVIGYSRPIGLPKKFDQTFLASLSFQKLESWKTSVGIGIRKQIGFDQVLDIGIVNDFNGKDRNRPLLKVGYGFSF